MLAKECRKELVDRCNAVARPLARHAFRAQTAPFIVRPQPLASCAVRPPPSQPARPSLPPSSLPRCAGVSEPSVRGAVRQRGPVPPPPAPLRRTDAPGHGLRGAPTDAQGEEAAEEGAVAGAAAGTGRGRPWHVNVGGGDAVGLAGPQQEKGLGSGGPPPRVRRVAPALGEKSPLGPRRRRRRGRGRGRRRRRGRGARAAAAARRCPPAAAGRPAPDAARAQGPRALPRAPRGPPRHRAARARAGRLGSHPGGSI